MNESNLHPYQHTGKDHLLAITHAGLLLDMGLGKTVTSLTVVNTLMYELFDISKVLVIAPKRVVESVWEDEAKKWDHVNHLTFSKIIGTEKQRKAALQAKVDIYLISRDNIAWLCGLYQNLPFDMLIIDELSSFKNHASQRFKALKKQSFKRVVGLTGTPAPNGLIDLWAQIYLLDKGERLEKTITAYRNKYFSNVSKESNYGIYQANKENQKVIQNKIADICLSMKAKDYLDLPEAIINDIYVDFPEKLQKQYNDFEREKVLELLSTEEEITAMNAAGLSNKLLQFANGAVYDENKEYHETHNLKIEALEEILEAANGKPVLVGWSFRHDMYRIMKYLKKYNPVEMKTDQDIKAWNAGKIKLMLMHPASGGHGLNLQAGGNIIVWFGQTWSLELYQQLNARLDRQGQTKAVIINRIICRNTLDQKVIRSLGHKDNTQNELMLAIKEIVKIYEILRK